MLVTGNLGSPSCLWLVKLLSGSSLSRRGEGFLRVVTELMGAQLVLSPTDINSIRHKQSLTQRLHPQLLRSQLWKAAETVAAFTVAPAALMEQLDYAQELC